MARDLHGKVAWVIGGASGVGKASALTLADAGMTVIASARRADALRKVADTIRGAIIPKVLDVADADAVETVCAEIAAEHGAIDVLVNSAGQNIAVRKWSEIKVEGWDQLAGVNASGAFYAMRAVLPHMRAQGGGLIINITSWGARFPLRFAGAAYTATKSAMLSLTQTMNMEEGANGIRACAVLPAAIASEMLTQRATPFPPEEIAKMLRPEDVARVVRFVAESPISVVLNEVVVSPVSNMAYATAP